MARRIASLGVSALRAQLCAVSVSVDYSGEEGSEDGKMITYYFGNAPRSSGHHCYTPQWTRPGPDAQKTPWTSNEWDPLCESAALWAIYGCLINDVPRWAQVEGVRHHLTAQGWTLLSWWDRSGDFRHGSHSTFALLGTLTADEAEAEVRRLFPAVWARMDAHLGKVQR